MMTDFEEQLRARLQAHAEEVTPDPETWGRVQARIRRDRRLRWLAAGAGATALAALAAVVVLALPGFLSGPGVELQPGPGMADQPEAPDTTANPDEQPDGVPSVAPADLVLATPDGVALLGPGGFGPLGDPGLFPAETVAVRPGSSLDDLEVVAADGCSLRRYQRDPMGVASHDVATADPAACASGPRFSPDGGHLAWIEATDDGPVLATVGWSDDGEVRVRNARFELDLGDLDDRSTLRVSEWVWVEDTGTAAEGFLALSARDGEGVNHLLMLQIQRQGDGALALHGPGPDRFVDADRRFVAYHRTATATWTLEVRGDGETVLTRQGEGPEVNDLHGFGDAGLGDAGPVWLEVDGETAVLGDGAGGAWVVRFTGDGWSDVERIAGADILHAAALGASDPADPAEPFVPLQEPGADPQADQVDGEQVAEPLPDGDETSDGSPVEQRLAAIRSAARAGDLDALAALTDPEEFSYSLGETGDPAGFWRREIADGVDVLGRLLAIVDLPSTQVPSEGGPTITAWPWVQDGTPYESLSSAELIILEDAVGSAVMDTYRDSGAYPGHRIGIRADGSWIYLVAGA